MTEHDGGELSNELFLPVEAAQAPEQITGPHYAWLRMPRFLDTRTQAINDTEGDVRIVDLCSAVPVYAELLRTRHYRTMFDYAREAAARLRTNLQEIDSDKFPTIANLPTPTRHELVTLHLRKNDVMTKLLTSVTADVLYEAGTKDENTDWQTHISGKIRDALWKTTGYKHRPTKRDRQPDLEDKWNIKFEGSELDQSFGDWLMTNEFTNEVIIEEVPELSFIGRYSTTKRLTPQTAEAIVGEVSGALAELTLDKYQPRAHLVASVDVASPLTLSLSAAESFGPDITNLDLYRRAIELPNHVVASIFELPYSKTESITMFSSIEGWPYYFGIDEADDFEQRREDMLQLAFQIYDTLKIGGIGLFFPWDTLKGSELDQIILDDVIRLWKNMGADINIDIKTGRELTHWMSETERLLATNSSPIFQDFEYDKLYPVMRLKKVKDSSRPWMNSNFVAKERIRRYPYLQEA